MNREINRDPILLGRVSRPAGPKDLPVADDLTDTLRANAERCVGMAANMIGECVRIIVFSDDGELREMFNPEILSASLPYTAEEGCLSLDGVRKTKRYQKIKVAWKDREFRPRVKTFTGFTAQIIQHEIDHLNGILI